MEPTMPAQNCMVRFVVLDSIWGMSESSLTRLNQKEAPLSERQASDLMGKLEGNSGPVLGVGITT